MKAQMRFLPLTVGLLIAAGALFIGAHPSETSLAAPAACVPGPHTGLITADETWCLADSPHALASTVTVAPGATVTLEPGVIVQTDSYPSYMGIVVQGGLESIGTEAQRITFTHVDASGQWLGIVVDGGHATLAHSTVEWGCSDSLRSNVRVVNSGNLVMTDSLVQECHNGSGTKAWNLLVENATASVSHSTLTASEWYPIYILGRESLVTLTENVLDGNLHDRIRLGANAMMGHDTVLTPQVVWDGYELEATLTVPPTVTLTLEPGVIIKTAAYPYDMGLVVQGKLEAVGTSGLPITLTSTDGTPAWAGVVVDGGRANLAYTTVEYGCSDSRKSNIAVINGGRLEMADSLLRECHYGGGAGEEMLWVENSLASIRSTTFRNSDGEHIYVVGDSTAIIADSSIEGAAENGLLVAGDQALVRVTGSTILNNGTDGVRNTGQATVILGGDPAGANWILVNAGFGANQTGLTGQILATYNWWGDASGPTHPTNPTGVGENVSDRVVFAPWLTETTVPPTIDRYVWVSGDDKVSISGQYRDYAFYFANVFSDTLHGALLVADLPWQADYVRSTNGGLYWPLHHRVIWKLGDVQVGQSFAGTVRVYYKWGIPEGEQMRLMGLAAASNLLNSRVDYAAHLAYEETTALTEQALTDAQAAALLAADSGLEALFSHALDQGFEFFGPAIVRALSDGSERVDLILMDRDRPGEIVFVRRIGDDRHIRRETNTALEIYDLTGGARFTFATSSWEFWGDLETGLQIGATGEIDPDTCMALSYGECLHNCLIQREPQKMTEGPIWGQSNCQMCLLCDDPTSCEAACEACAVDLWRQNKDDGDYEDRCTYKCNDVLARQSFKCTQPLEDCYPAERNGIWINAEYRREYTCDENCRYTPTIPQLQYCRNGCNGNSLGAASGGSCCESTSDWWAIRSCTQETECPICDGITCDPFPVVATVAHDPNAMYGPDVAAPGQTVLYTIETENVGAGTAYGVFVESALPPELDADTLVVGENGIYFPATRKLFWEIGTLDAAGGAAVTFSAQVPAETASGTLLTASARVHFPSVPEITPTNDAITLIGDVVAYPQRLETVEGMPAEVTLGGYAVSGEALSYAVLRRPLNGTLTGTPPDLVYTPAANFEGADAFSFQVTDGTSTSLSAEVLILVNTGTETARPQIVFTSPQDGEAGVLVFKTPVYEESYYPLIWAQFTEPLDATTLTGSTVYLSNAAGDRILGDVVYQAAYNRVQFVLNQPLAYRTTYTLTITTGVRDTSGNAMGADYAWSFTSAQSDIRLYLPVVLRR